MKASRKSALISGLFPVDVFFGAASTGAGEGREHKCRRILYDFLKKILFPLSGERSHGLKKEDIPQEIMESRFGMADAPHPCRKEHGALDGKGGERVDGRMVHLAASCLT